ncbi:hypothetical protein [Methylobacterium sp. 17Sr1-1]|uniref:hypothetical protein n=1 Tax=Methylobacterium sp. 17Sr1-1 TaxID=2202826 RepID=UPI0013A5928F|nr:hypothetical protein [Methylobacterium sp. 17Sr1-1]
MTVTTAWQILGVSAALIVGGLLALMIASDTVQARMRKALGASYTTTVITSAARVSAV